MLTFPFGSDIKFTLIPKVGDVPIPQSEMVDLTIKVENKNRGVSFVPIWEWNDVGIEIEVQRNQIKVATIYTVVLDWRRPDSTYSDGYQDRMNYCTLISFSTSCDIVSEDTAVIEVSPEYKGDKGDKGDPFTYADFTPEQIAELQQPATDAIASIQEVELAVETAEGLRSEAETSRNTAEGERQTNTATAILQANAARDLANEKAGLAATATTEANTARDEANLAATAANTKAGEANTAAMAANTAAQNADDARDNIMPSVLNNEEVQAETYNDLNARITALEAIITNKIKDRIEVTKEFNVWGKTNLILTGSGAATFAPDFIGQKYIDTAGGNVYVAVGTANAGNWKLV